MMYRITYNGEEIYTPTLEMAVLNPTLETELNSAGTLTFILPQSHIGDIWNTIQIFRGEVRVWEGDDCIWFGRPLQIVRDWNNQKKVVCEGALAYFNDSVQPTKEYKLGVKKTPLYNDEQYARPTYKLGFFESLLDAHNQQVMFDQSPKAQGGPNSRCIYPGVIDVDNELVWRRTDNETTAEALQQMCLADISFLEKSGTKILRITEL